MTDAPSVPGAAQVGGDAPVRAAFYARRGGPAADWWSVLHPPYTLWHVSYVAFGACLVPKPDWAVLGATLVAFFLAVGIAAHALDEWRDRPLRTGISGAALWAAAVASLVGAAVLGVVAVAHCGPVLVVFIVVGVALVLGYNLELFGGAVHTDLGFALSWGAFPVVVGYVAQAPVLLSAATLGAVAAAGGATILSAAQRGLSTRARELRRRTSSVTGAVVLADGTTRAIDRAALLAPLERALRALSWTVPLLAAAALLGRAPH
jgi:hypothetical protein